MAPALLLLALFQAAAPDPPVLRIEAQMHTAPIRAAATDGRGELLLTVSNDKSARVWDVASGRLLRVLRPLLGRGFSGMLYAAALSPDGHTAAVGGWSLKKKDNDVFLFDQSTGVLVRRLGGLPSLVIGLAFSPDGRRLAVTLGEQGGLRVYHAPSGTELLSEPYDEDTYGVDFDPGGRLVTASYDGWVRLYDAELHLLARVRAPGGRKPRSVRFSPDGSRLALGYVDAGRVDVLSARDLSLVASTRGDATVGAFSFVAWSHDGQTLHAGGTHRVDGRWAVRRWGQEGRGLAFDTPVAESTVLGLATLPRGRIAFVSGEPGWGLIGPDGVRESYVGPPITHARGEIRLSPHGDRLQLTADRSFSLPERALGAAVGTLIPPVTELPGHPLAGWSDDLHPTLRGTPLPVAGDEMSRSVAWAPDGSGFALGAEWRLYFFDRSGQQRWSKVAPGPAWAVNVTSDGRLVVAYYGDGTRRWHRARDGQELLALFPHADGRRWAAWTPSGYYDASPGGEDLIGWQVNNGLDAAADFFPASRFRAARYRPDVVAQVLEALDEAEAVRLADAARGRAAPSAEILGALPPVVEVLEPADGASVATAEAVVRVRVRSAAPVTAVRALVDGRPSGERRVERAGSAEAEVRELRVSLPERDCEVSVIAESEHGASAPATVRLRWAGTAAVAAPRPKLYVLAVGVGRHRRPELSLRFAGKDARDFAAALLAQKGALYSDVVTRVLADEEATREAVLDGFDWVVRQTTARDVAMVAIAGHGVNDDAGRYFFMPTDGDPDRLRATAVPWTDVKAAVEAVPGKVLFFVDTCHAGNVMGARRALDVNSAVNELASAENGAVVFAASTGRQYSLENEAWGNGAFTKAVIEGLSGRADLQKTGKVTVSLLEYYVAERVKELTQGRQSPTTTKPQTVPDFPVALSR